jgi:hypothetical protein
VLQLSQSGDPRAPRDASTCDARARFNYKVAVGPVKNNQCGAYQVSSWHLSSFFRRISESGSRLLVGGFWVSEPGPASLAAEAAHMLQLSL